jgi:hypothetical protein
MAGQAIAAQLQVVWNQRRTLQHGTLIRGRPGCWVPSDRDEKRDLTACDMTLETAPIWTGIREGGADDSVIRQVALKAIRVLRMRGDWSVRREAPRVSPAFVTGVAALAHVLFICETVRDSRRRTGIGTQ